MPLVELKQISPRIHLDIVYATPQNFTGQAVYTKPLCYLQRAVAERLHRVQTALEQRGMGLKIFDGYRPWSVQKIFWEIYSARGIHPNPAAIADPAEGSKHNRGAAVDATLVNAQGRELLMPSAFDEFSERAHRSYGKGPREALNNRQTLQEAMEQEGFLPLPEEWWHFDDPDWELYPLLDTPFEKLESR